MDLQQLKKNAIRVLTFLFLLSWFPRSFGTTFSRNGDYTLEFLCIGLIIILVLILWIVQKATGIQNNYLVLGSLIGGGFAIAWQHTGSLASGVSFLAYGLILIVLLIVYEKVTGERVELVSGNILTIAGTLIAAPAVIIIVAPLLFSLDTFSFIIVGCFIALILFPVFHTITHPVADFKLDEAYEEDIELPVSLGQAFSLCTQSAGFLPYSRILDAVPDSGTLHFSAADSVGRTSTITVTLRSKGAKETSVNVAAANEFIDSEYRILTGRNELFVKIVIRFLQVKTHLPATTP